MNDNNQNQEDSNVQTLPIPLKVFRIALLISIAVYLFVASMLHSTLWSKQDFEGALTSPLFDWMLVGMAGIATVAALLIRGKWLRRLASRPIAQGASDESEVEAKFLEVFTKAQALNIVAWAFAESVAVFGLVLSFLHQEVSYLWPFAGVSLILLARMSPVLPERPSGGALREGDERV